VARKTKIAVAHKKSKQYWITQLKMRIALVIFFLLLLLLGLTFHVAVGFLAIVLALCLIETTLVAIAAYSTPKQ